MLYRRRRYGVARTFSYGKRPSDPSQSYTRGGIAAADATALYCHRRCSVERTVSHDNYDYRCTAAETAGYAPRSSSPRARLVGIARIRFPKPGRRNVAPVVAAGQTNAAVRDDCRVAHKFLSSWLFCFLKKKKSTLCKVLSLEKALSVYLSICSIKIARVALSASSACYAVLVLHCLLHGFHFLLYRKSLQAFYPKNRYRVSGVRASDHTLTLLF